MRSQWMYYENWILDSNKSFLPNIRKENPSVRVSFPCPSHLPPKFHTEILSRATAKFCTSITKPTFIDLWLAESYKSAHYYFTTFNLKIRLSQCSSPCSAVRGAAWGSRPQGWRTLNYSKQEMCILYDDSRRDLTSLTGPLLTPLTPLLLWHAWICLNNPTNDSTKVSLRI